MARRVRTAEGADGDRLDGMEPIEIPIEDSLDLHTFQPREVRSVVEEYLEQALLRGFGVVRIIHGRGIGVQREIVRSVLKNHEGVLSYHDTPDRGSTEVFLRVSGSRPDETLH